MARLGIIGSGRAAALHAHAAVLCDRVELVGVGGGSSNARELSAATAAPDLDLETLVECSDVVVVAVPPDRSAEVVQRLGGRADAVLVEAPVGLDVPDPGCPTMVGANLLHAPVVRAGLRAIEALTNVHHLQLRSTQPQTDRGTAGTTYGGAGTDPAARLAPVLLAAAGEPAAGAIARIVTGEIPDLEIDARFEFTFASGRTAELHSTWSPGLVRAELEAADDSGVVLVSLLPEPRLEINGALIGTDDDHPLVGLGFVAQLRRLAAVGAGRSTPWLELGAGQGIAALMADAVNSAERHN